MEDTLNYGVPPKLNNNSSWQLCSFRSKIPISFQGDFKILPGSESAVIPGLQSHWVFPHHRQAAGKAIKIPRCGFKKVQEASKTGQASLELWSNSLCNINPCNTEHQDASLYCCLWLAVEDGGKEKKKRRTGRIDTTYHTKGLPHWYLGMQLQVKLLPWDMWGKWRQPAPIRLQIPSLGKMAVKRFHYRWRQKFVKFYR